MIGKWENIKFGTISSFRNGLNFTKDSHGEGLKLIGVPDFQDYFKPIFESVGEISSIDTLKKDDYLKKGDILFVRSNGNKALVGRSLYIDKNIPSVFSGFCIRARIFDKDSSSLFYAYFTRTKEFRALLSAASGGTNIQNLNQKILNNVLVPRPPIEMQQKIASILSAYDDLIENNLKRIKLLEEKAQLTYEEWFVRIKFPGHESVELDKDTGLPEGWKTAKASEKIKLISGYAFKGKEFTDEPNEHIAIRMGNFKVGGGLKTDKSKYLVDHSSVKEKFHLNHNDLVMVLSDVTREGLLIGNVGFVPNDGRNYYLNQRVSKVVLDENFKMYAYATFNSQSFKQNCIAKANSVTVLNLKNDDVYGYKMLIPTQSITDLWNKNYGATVQSTQNLERQNQLLKEARDILLPRLMTGMIDVEKMELQEIKEQPLGMVAEEKSKYETNQS